MHAGDWSTGLVFGETFSEILRVEGTNWCIFRAIFFLFFFSFEEAYLDVVQEYARLNYFNAASNTVHYHAHEGLLRNAIGKFILIKQLISIYIEVLSFLKT